MKSINIVKSSYVTWTVALVFGATEMHIHVCICVYAAAGISHHE